ncbi:hypothetical protein FA13DRAFT_1123226 [Coprinellus micaceus]|uniref:Uncharacterized protein n=1 Tax=Coprinellus micaceus TaxID=71717 RepID=A0A4Y7SVW3_COPMI|nr:hypothetical protein FA13DRAFT_1123226 [Coprinellus micaceus]
MTNLASFTLHSARHHCSKILDSGLHSFRATLHTLQITIAVDITSWTLPTSTLLPNLRHFEVNLNRCSLYPGDGLFNNTLAPFLNARRTTIESLTVGLYRCTLIHLSAILDPLDPFPHLAALSLTQNLPSEFPKVENEAQIVASAIHRFVLHSAPKRAQLEVDLWPGALAAFASQPFNDSSSQVHSQIQTLKKLGYFEGS